MEHRAAAVGNRGTDFKTLELPDDPAVVLAGRDPGGHLYVNVHSSASPSGQDVKAPKCPSAGEWMSTACAQTAGCGSAMERKQSGSCHSAGAPADPILSEGRHSRKAGCCARPLWVPGVV